MTSSRRHYLITGAGRGLGRGLSRALLQNGHRVFLLDNDAKELIHHADELAKTHVRGKAFEIRICDLRKLDEIRSAITHATSFFDGHLDVLVNNAAYTSAVGSANTSNISIEQWNASIETNLTAPLFISQFSIPILQQNESRRLGGSVVNISSTRAFMSEPDNEGYSATKAGLLGLTQSMAVSLASKNIRVNAILPGWIHVANECKLADEEGRTWQDGLSEHDHRWHLTGRVGNVDDVLRAVEYLTTSDFVTGSEMVVDGGVTRKMVYPV